MLDHSADRTLVRTAGAVAAVLAAATLTACSSSSGGGGATTSTPTTAQTTTTVPAPAPATTGVIAPSSSSSAASSSADAGSGSSGTSGPAACRESQLRAQIDPRPVGAATADDRAVIVDFINTSSTSCTMHGYPGAALVNAQGKQVLQATRTIRGKVLGLPTGVSTLPTVTLKPGAVASAGLEGVSKLGKGTTAADCGFYSRILVTPPNTTTAVPFTVRWPSCFTFTVHPSNLEPTAN